MARKLKTTRPARVEKIIPGQFTEPEKAEISIEGADHLYREIRIENVVEDGHGGMAKLKPGSKVEVTVEADPKDTVPKEDSAPASHR